MANIGKIDISLTDKPNKEFNICKRSELKKGNLTFELLDKHNFTLRNKIPNSKYTRNNLKFHNRNSIKLTILNLFHNLH
jgi:hypothetical protein